VNVSDTKSSDQRSWPRQQRQWGAQSERPLASTTLPYLQTFLAVEPSEPLLVHGQAFSFQQEVQTPVAEAAAYLRKFPHAQPNSTFIRSKAPVAHRRPINT
jgi:hypothetical protein